MSSEINKALAAAVLRLLRPLVRVLLRNGISYGEFADLARWIFVDVAAQDFGIPGRKQSVSRVSVITGLNRKEVTRLQKLRTPDDEAVGHQYNRAARVITGWVRDVRFHDSDGRPSVLRFDGEGPTFADLVRRHSGDMPARAILDELLRVGAVQSDEDNRITLLESAYIPKTGELDKLHILGTDVAALLDTIDHNLKNHNGIPYFQRKVAYDNLPREAIAEFQRLSAEKGQELLVELDRYLSQHDRDANPSSEGTGRMHAGVGIYYFEDDVSEEK